ncbi:MAG: DUF4922 domain-containing protein, partial [Ignavibacteriae bacterium]|nr:DUF4922 domain-containing protein [Ignavibacteriota bacterium]
MAESDWSSKAHALLQQQLDTWPLLRKGYADLDLVETIELEIDGFTYRVQFNPGRLTSSVAKVDDKSIRERKCFLCMENLPELQRGVRYNDEFIILCNPFPIFFEHFTIPHVKHIPQEITASFGTLLALSQDCEDRYTVFYNGPKCGASAPDHLHFQMGSKGFMPIDDEYDEMITKFGEKIADDSGLLVFAVGNQLRKFISIEADDALQIEKAFRLLLSVMKQLSPGEDEPMMNIVSSFQDGEWRVIVFPRAKHRPSFFFREGEGQMLISPAAVDFGGAIITPVERDFQRITADHIIEMFTEVAASEEYFNRMRDQFVERFIRL